MELVILLLIVFFRFGSTLTTEQCPPNLTRGKELRVFGQSCFKFHTSGHLDYFDARALCIKSNGTLAMPKTKAINDFLAKQLGHLGVTKDAWIGLTDERIENSYYWQDDTPMNWNNFGMHEGPDNSRMAGYWENCIAMTPNSGTWHDHHCETEYGGLVDHHKPFVCQYDIMHILTSFPAVSTSCPFIECDLDCGTLGYQLDRSNCLTCKCNIKMI